MGLTRNSTGPRAAKPCPEPTHEGPALRKRGGHDRVIALAGNPNVGKSTVFNALTGMRQHTGNWPGKTVSNAQGTCSFHGRDYILMDLPGCYSLLAHSAEEEAARDFLCFGGADGAVVVCDATCLERNLNLVLQALEITPRAAVCVNLLDEAKRKGIKVDLEKLSRLLGVPVVGAAARSGKGLDRLMKEAEKITGEGFSGPASPPVPYDEWTEAAVSTLSPTVARLFGEKVSPRWLSLRLLEGPDESLDASLAQYLGRSPRDDPEIAALLREIWEKREAEGVAREGQRDRIVSAIVRQAEKLARAVTSEGGGGYSPRDRKLDALLTGKLTAFPVMLLLLLGVFWLTIVGANYPSELLSAGLFWLGDRLRELFLWLNAPAWLTGLLVDGVYKTLAWVTSVMLPPMAIFFPLFTLLEDLGYLPRVAFNLDRGFRACGACGKQALTTCMVHTNLQNPCAAAIVESVRIEDKFAPLPL